VYNGERAIRRSLWFHHPQKEKATINHAKQSDKTSKLTFQFANRFEDICSIFRHWYIVFDRLSDTSCRPYWITEDSRVRVCSADCFLHQATKLLCRFCLHVRSSLFSYRALLVACSKLLRGCREEGRVERSRRHFRFGGSA